MIEFLVILWNLVKGPFFAHHLLHLYSFQAENKGENETDESDKAQDGENEKNSEKEQDSEISEETKSGNLREILRFYYVKLKATGETWAV